MAGAVRGLLAPWIGGASAPPGAPQAGFRGLLAPWVGGAGVSPVGAGFTSLFAFWAGGGGSYGVTPEPEPPLPIQVHGSVGAPRRQRFRIPFSRKLREDEEIIVVVAAALQIIDGQP